MIILYRPVGKEELDLIEKSNWIKFPPRFNFQPIFYPVLNEEYATEIANWNVSAYGCGFITRFSINKKYISKFEIKNVGGEIHNELWIPSDQLEEFNSNIIGKIELIKSLYK